MNNLSIIYYTDPHVLFFSIFFVVSQYPRAPLSQHYMFSSALLVFVEVLLSFDNHPIPDLLINIQQKLK